MQYAKPLTAGKKLNRLNVAQFRGKLTNLATLLVYRVLAFGTFHYWPSGEIANFPRCN